LPKPSKSSPDEDINQDQGRQRWQTLYKTSLDIFWLKDDSLTDLDNLPDPDELAEEIIENLEAGLTSFREILAAL
jgi:hypothetical protein